MLKPMAKSHLKLVTTVKRTVTPKRRRNDDLRTREYLTETEVERLMKTATGMRAAMRWRTVVTIRGRCRRTLGIKTFSTQFAILSYHRLGSKTFGENEP
jgi:hypothetical protein